MLQDTLRETGSPGDFLGHLSATDYLIVTQPENSAALKERSRKRLEQSFDYFYRDQDRGSCHNSAWRWISTSSTQAR